MKKNILIVILIMIYAFFLGILASCDKQQDLNPIKGTWQGETAKYVFTDSEVTVSTTNPDIYCKGVYVVNKDTLELFIGYLKTTYSYKIVDGDTLYLVTKLNKQYKYKRN